MRSLLSLSLVVAMLPRPALSVPATPASVARRGARDAGEARVEKLIAQMGAARYRRREDAYEQLKAMGPAIVPLLVKYRDHVNPEIRERVRQIIGDCKWMTRGAVVVSILPGTQAERLGFKPGDVVVKINDIDITSHRDLQPTLGIQERTYHIWRAGRIITHKVKPGLVGYRSGSWDYAKGGNNQSRGVAALTERRYAEAYRQLSAAAEEGMQDTWCFNALCGLAAYELDHKRARELYARARNLSAKGCSWSHYNISEMFSGLPMTSVHSAYLVDRLKKERFSAQLWHQLDCYCVSMGRNLPLARMSTAKVWPKGAKASEHDRYWHIYGRARIALHDRRWEEVLRLREQAGKFGPTTDRLDYLALQAALYEHDVSLACGIARRLLDGYRSGRANSYYAMFSMYAVAGAVAAGRDDLASPLLEALAKLPPDKLSRVAGSDANHSWKHVGVDIALVSFMEKNFAAQGAMYLNHVYLYGLVRSPDCTPERWEKAFAGLADQERNRRWFRWLNAVFQLRAGRYARAVKATARTGDTPGRKALAKALRFLSAHAERLEKDWPELKGVFQMYDAAEKGCYWAVRYDGRCFYLDADGRIHEYPGLAPGQGHQAACGDSIRAHPNGTIYVRRNQIYLFDGTAKRWLPTYASPCRATAHEDYWSDRTGPVVLRYVLKEYPTAGPGRGMWRRVAGPGGWLYYEFDGDFVLIVHPETLKLIDLSRAIARAAGRTGRVAVYRVRRVDGDRKVLIPTEIGLWAADAEGRLSRVELGLKDPDVYVSVLDWPERKHKVYVGVAPQQGGQIVELDVATLAHRPTGGFCGVGPKDSFFNIRKFPRRVVCEYAIQAIYEKRLAAESTAKAK